MAQLEPSDLSSGLEAVLRRFERALEGAADEEALVEGLLAPFDDLERAQPSASEHPVLGPLVRQARVELIGLFGRAGLTPVRTWGAPFDPHVHEALAVRPTASVAPDHVIDVWTRGWRRGERLVRPAQVVVSKAPEAVSAA